MMMTMLLLLLAITVLNGILLDLLPRRSSRRTYFGVTTGEDFVSSPDGKNIGRDYKISVWIATLVSMALVLVASQSHSLLMLPCAVLLQAGVAAAAWVRAWTRSKQQTAQRNRTDVHVIEDNVRLSFFVQGTGRS